MVEDNELIRDGVKEYFEVSGYEMRAFSNISQTREALQYLQPDAIILDIMLPDGNGFVFAKELRRTYDIPIVFLTAKEEVSDRIMGFEVGGDDYVVKPFSNKELLLRIEAVLRRTGKMNQDDDYTTSRWKLGSHTLIIDNSAHKVYVDERELHLTTSEWKLLVFLSRRSNQAISRDMLLGECLGYMYSGSERTVDTHIANLRNNLGANGWIETIRGFGYRFGGELLREDTLEYPQE